MNRWKTPVAGICTCFLVVVALLSVLFIVMNGHPDEKIDVSSTDMRVLDRVSAVWCGWQEVSSTYPITVYRITGEPIYERSPSVNYHLSNSIKLQWGREKELKYFLLPGSSLKISACSSYRGVFLSIFQGLNKWRECQRLRNKTPFHYDSDSSSSEESHEVNWESNNLKEFLKKKLGKHGYPSDCKEAMHSHEIPSGKECWQSMVSLKISKEDTYIFSLENYHNSVDESRTDIKLFVNRTRYDTRHSMVVCRDVSMCDVPLSFGSDQRSVVAVAAETQAGDISYMVVAKCKPRVLFFILLFAFVPLLLLLCIGCVIFCFRRRGQKKTSVKYIQVPNNKQTNTPDRPLLSGPEITLYSRTDTYNRPPFYPESSAPPPYMPPQVSESKKERKNSQGHRYA